MSSREIQMPREFLVNSLDYYQIALAMLGMLFDPADWQNAAIPDPNGDLQYRGRRYRLDLAAVRLGSPFTLDDLPRAPRCRAESMNRALAFRALTSLYDAYVADASNDVLIRECEQFLPSLACAVGVRNEFLDNVVPQPVLLRPRDFQEIRGDVVSCFLGGGRCRWNNVTMAEAAARVATTQRTQAHLEWPLMPVPMSESLPAPLNDPNWHELRLFEPLTSVAAEGTADALAGIVAAPYVGLFKTGTLQERDNGRESEMLLFVVGRRVGGRFVPGATVAGFAYMEDSKLARGTPEQRRMRKFEFAGPILRRVVRYLQAVDRLPLT